MGIPSYFRRILQKYPRIVRTSFPSDVSALCMDFNCLIYTVARDYEKEVVYPGPGDEGVAWEKELCKRVAAATYAIYCLAGRPARCVLCLDGVVPMAKIRQQRMRRFKSAWLKRLDAEQHAVWDTNCITPGTGFMRRLSNELAGLRARCGGSGFVLSDTESPGEGEHKIMSWIRANGAELKGSVLVYGLDADLLLLTMLASNATSADLVLLREHVELGGAVKLDGEQVYVTMSIRELRHVLRIESEESCMRYVGLMSLMGNDFVPHGLTHRLTEDGHDMVLREMGNAIVVKDESGRWVYNKPVLAELVRRWSRDEAHRLQKCIERKRAAARLPARVGPDGRPQKEYESWPLQWDVEKRFVDGDGRLVEEWSDIYWTFLHSRADKQWKLHVCEEYLRGLQWILDYYTAQRPVSKEWMFPCWLPPLWSDLSLALEGEKGCVDVGLEHGDALRPCEQLAMVLPRESYWLVEDTTLRRLPVLAPQWFPVEFEIHSVGKRWMWECEVLLPTVTKGALRAAIAEASLS